MTKRKLVTFQSHSVLGPHTYLRVKGKDRVQYPVLPSDTHSPGPSADCPGSSGYSRSHDTGQVTCKHVQGLHIISSKHPNPLRPQEQARFGRTTLEAGCTRPAEQGTISSVLSHRPTCMHLTLTAQELWVLRTSHLDLLTEDFTVKPNTCQH